MKTLIVYYSRSGRTGQVAIWLAKQLGADIEQIEDAPDRRGFWGYLRSAYEALTAKIPDIAPMKHDAANYDLVILGTPVWAARVSSPVRAYIEAQRGQFKQLAFFCCQGGSGGESVFRELSVLCQHVPVATQIVTEQETRTDQYISRAGQFAQAIKEAGRRWEARAVSLQEQAASPELGNP